MIRGYDVYRICQRMRHWTVGSLETYLTNNTKDYYECLAKYLFEKRKLDNDKLIDFIRINYSYSEDIFDPFTLMEEKAWQNYQHWLSTASTKALYWEQIRKSILFIENFCIDKNITLEEYANRYSTKHIRENKIEYCVAIYLDLVNVKELNKVEKMLLQSFIKQYNICRNRLSNPELKEYIETLTMEMKNIITENINNKKE